MCLRFSICPLKYFPFYFYRSLCYQLNILTQTLIWVEMEFDSNLHKMKDLVVRLADGSIQKSTSATWLVLQCTKTHFETHSFLLVPLGNCPVILGMDWLQKRNPHLTTTCHPCHLAQGLARFSQYTSSPQYPSLQSQSQSTSMIHQYIPSTTNNLQCKTAQHLSHQWSIFL